MPADLTITSLKLPSPLRAPCPLKILVTVKNIGSDAADPGPFDVTVDIGAGDSPSVRFETIAALPEGQRLSPGSTLGVPVTVEFPCTSPAVLRATVDLKRQVSNNVPTAPSLLLNQLMSAPVPWLKTGLQVGIRDPAGTVTFDPDGFCSGKDVVAQITITNYGCTASKPCQTEVTLEDPGANPSPTVLGIQTYLTPALIPGQTHTQLLAFATPASAAGTSGTLGVRVKADAKVANPDQCDPASLGAWIAKPFAAGASPRLTLTVGGAGVIRPGEIPALSWSVRNDCNEIGTADVRILFGAPPTELYKTTLAIPLQSRVSEDLTSAAITIPTPIASAFWAIGTHSLDLEVTGNGANGGPFRVTVPFNVIGEPIDSTWWTWGMSSAALWKSSYFVTGTFSNRGLASMKITALTALEHPTDVMGTGQDLTVPPFLGAFTATAAPGGSIPATFSRFQAWQWLARGTVVEVGPRSRPFSYVATFSVTDVFGNAYAPVSSGPTTVTITVSGTKLSARTSGGSMIGVGLFFLAMAVIAATQGPYGWIGGVVLAAIGMALIIAGQIFLYDADDPAIPDFREGGLALANPRAWNIPKAGDDENLHALWTLALVVSRAVSAQLRASQHKALAWAAFLDRDEGRRIDLRDRGRGELETLRRLVPATIDAADEAHKKWERLASEIQVLPTSGQLREMSQRFAADLGLTDAERKILNERLNLCEDKEIQESFELSRAGGWQNIGPLLRMSYEALSTEFDGRDYLG